MRRFIKIHHQTGAYSYINIDMIILIEPYSGSKKSLESAYTVWYKDHNNMLNCYITKAEFDDLHKEGIL